MRGRARFAPPTRKPGLVTVCITCGKRGGRGTMTFRERDAGWHCNTHGRIASEAPAL